MRSRTLWICVLGVMVCAFSAGIVPVVAADRPTDASKAGVDRTDPIERVSSGNLIVVDDPNLPVVDTLNVPPSTQMELFPLPKGLTFKQHTVGGDQAEGATALADRLIYSNTLGKYSARVTAGYLVGDDISTTAPVGCSLASMTAFTFQVTGQGDPNLPPAPYGVSWALYDDCPGAWSATYRPQLIIGGTSGSESFPDGAPRTITFHAPTPVNVPTTFWLGLTFTGDNAGPILGAPAFEGFSGDVFDFPGFACDANLGGFPGQPHASFNAEVFGSNCAQRHLAYKAQRSSGTPYRGGRNRWFADDLNLITDECKLVEYEVAVKGNANYYFELRNSCAAPAIPGTQTQQLIGTFPPEVRQIRKKVAYICDASSANPDADCKVDSDCQGGGTHPQGKCKKPIPLPASPWFAMRISNDTGGVIAAGRQADIGWTNDYFGIRLPDGTCQLSTLGSGIHAAFHISITCDGDAPKGACCDMFVTDENDDAVCRELARVNCPFPPPQTGLRPQWIEGAACNPDPFVEGTCGEAACCYKDANEDEYCRNLTKNECYEVPPIANKRQWQRGRFCSLDNQHCPLNACLAREGPCTEARVCPGVGCSDPTCCTHVCVDIPFQWFCCDVCWDNECAQIAQIECPIPPNNDECAGTRPGEGAELIPVPHRITTEGRNATYSDTDPEFCCHPGTPFVCIDSAGVMTNSCETDGDCGSGFTCQQRPPVGLASVWYKFIAPEPLEPGEDRSSVSVSTCGTSGSQPTVDSLLQVFSVGDPTSDETACNSLSLIGCSDDVPGCADGGANGELCLKNLIPGDVYYVVVAAKTHEAADRAYTLDVNSPCPQQDLVPNDFCLGALPFTVCDANSEEPGQHCYDDDDCRGNGGTYPNGLCVDQGVIDFDMTDATLHCPGDFCAPGMEKDMWYEYTSTCTGLATIDTCSGETQPDTNLMVYEGCETCPSAGEQPVACNTNSDECDFQSLASSVTIPVSNGDCYKIRIGNQEGSNPVGQLSIHCEALCEVGPVQFVDPRNGTLDARSPHASDSVVPPMGIDTFEVTAPPGAPDPMLCWRLCETEMAGGEANFITDVVEGEPGVYTISLARPITPDAHSTLEYLGNLPVNVGRFTSHPGNTNADFAVFTDDVELLVNTLKGFGFPPFGEYSEDINHSGMFTPVDLLALIDILNGAEAFDPPRLNTTAPSTAGCPPE